MNNKQFNVIIGVQGDAEALEKARAQRDEVFYKTSKGMKWEDYIAKCTAPLYINTWQDKLSNLSLVFNRVKNSPLCPKILAMKVEGADKKGRRDFYVLTEDNIKFEKLFSDTLSRMKEEYKKEEASLFTNLK